LQRRLDDQDQEIEGLEQDNEHNKDVINMLESELMEFNKDNSKFVLECALEEEKERISRLKQTKSGLETDVARYKVQSKAAAKTAKEQEVKISQLERELAENKTLHAGSKNAKEKLDRLEKQWASMRRLMNENPDDVVMKMEVKSEEN
jgi:chromosome segregation ATPase